MSTTKLLAELGVDDALAASLTDETVPQVIETITNKIKSKLLEDETFYSTIDKSKLPNEWFKEKFSEGEKKIASLSKQAIDKHFSITEADKETFSEEERKDINKYVAKATSIYKAKTGSTSTDVAKLQDENLQLKQMLEGRENEIKTLSEKFDSDLREKLTAKETETLALIEASGLQPNVPVSINLIWDKVYGAIKNKYAVVVENGVTSIRKKDNISFKVEKADKSGHMELKDAIAEELKAMGAWKEQQQHQQQQQQKTVPITPGKGGLTEKEKAQLEYEKQFHA